MKKYTPIILLGAALLMASCKKVTTGTTTSLPVVEAYLMGGNAISVKLYQQKALTDTATYGAPITGQQLSVSDGNNTVQLVETAKGIYTYSDIAFLTAGKTYTLIFKYLAETVTAKTTMPAKPADFATQYAVVYPKAPSGPNAVPDTINRFTWANPDSLHHVLVFKSSDGPEFPLGSRGNNTETDFELNTDRKSGYYVTTNVIPFYGHYKVILLRVNQEYIDLLKSNTGRSTSQNLVNTPTNVTNGFGIFTAMQADTLSFNVL
ncbi:DUF4249 family protein [Mucilaginibacter sp.]|uniref:DUF4249 family protein n=1 Tax=Mucilaginibacter sp. TaxID=1882438 RepID=UPI0025D81D7F|nr:DUF4249 family protein [Mucilaginibacter sp.]